jgi:CubicO group peptidase (beta-lactamase class C family)
MFALQARCAVRQPVTTLAAVNLFLALCATGGIAFAQPIHPPDAQGGEPETIRRMLVRLHEGGEFTGTILVARDGVPIYRDAIAAPADAARALLDEPVDIGSVAKGFTAMAVMMLAEQGKLRYDDPVGRHLPALAEAAPAITLRHLLTHTSGIPDVGDLGIDRPNLLERDVVEAVRTQHKNFARPGLRYRYSNAGYNLLAMVVEAVSGQRFDDFLQKRIVARLEIADAVTDILHHRPYTPPRLSIARYLSPVIKAKGVDSAIAVYHGLRAAEPNVYDFGKGELNGLGYGLLGMGDVAGAIRVFELNAQQYPGSSNAFDSLGEAYAKGDRRDDARKAYLRAVELDPANTNARTMLQKLK